MIDKARRREVARAFVERKRSQGVYAVRCAASGEIWVAASRNLDTQQNSVWFALRSGGHPNRSVQAAWNAHGAEAFVYEILEEASDDGLTPMGLADRLKDLVRRWRETLGAKALVG